MAVTKPKGPKYHRECLYAHRGTYPSGRHTRTYFSVVMRALSKLSDRDLIERYHELLQHEPTVEAHDRIMDVSRGRSWLERAAASERDSAIDAEKAACEREFASRGITEREVLGG